MRIRHRCERAYLVDIVRGVGGGDVPRPALVWPEASAVWVSPIGSDANSGLTIASPKATLEAGVTTAGVSGRPIVALDAPANYGPHTYTIGSVVTPGAGKQINATIGTFPQVASADPENYFLSFANSDNAMFGVTFTTCPLYCSNVAGVSNIQNCSFYSRVGIGGETQMAFCFMGGTIPTITEDYGHYSLSLSGSSNSVFNNCIFVPPINAPSDSSLLYGLLLVTDTPAGSIQFAECTFGGQNPIGIRGSGGVNPTTFAYMLRCSFEGLLAVVRDYITFPPPGIYFLSPAHFTMERCFTAGAPFMGVKFSPTSSIIYTSTYINPIPDSALPLFQSPAAARAGDPAGYRLQRRGVPVLGDPSRIYSLNSQLADVDGPGTQDAAPWLENVTPGAVAFSEEAELRWEPSQHTREDVPEDSARLVDPNGNPFFAFSAESGNLKFQWSSHVGNRTANKVQTLQADRGSKLLFPWDDDGSHFTDGVYGWFDAASMTFAPYLSTVGMDPGHWKGWVIWLYTPGERMFLVTGNDHERLTLADVFGSGLPASGAWPFHVRALLVNQQPTNVRRNQAYYTRYTDGGAWRERPDGPQADDHARAPFEYQGLELNLSVVTVVTDWREA